MKRFAARVVVWWVLVLGVTQAMPIPDFAKMNDDDDATYVTALVEGAAKWLRSHGQPAQADKVIAFFKDSSKQGGLNQLVMAMKTMNNENNRNAINPNNRVHVLDVEDAMGLTLHDNGIDVPLAYLQSHNKNFQASGLPRPRVPMTPSRDAP